MSTMHENYVNTHITRHGASPGGQHAFRKCSSPSCIFKIRLTTCDLACARYVLRLKLEVVFSKTYFHQVVSHGPESLGSWRREWSFRTDFSCVRTHVQASEPGVQGLELSIQGLDPMFRFQDRYSSFRIEYSSFRNHVQGSEPCIQTLELSIQNL